MATPCLTIDVGKLERNARAVVDLCRAHGIEVCGVTKGVCGHPDVARAMLAGGVASIGDSRLENVARLRAAGLRAPCWLIRLPSLSSAGSVVELTGTSLNSEIEALGALSAAAIARGRTHRVVVMVDLGDLREGLWPDEVVPFVRAALALPGIRVAGIGANLACFAGVVPSSENMGLLLSIARDVEARFDLRLDWISAGNSSTLDLLLAGGVPVGINHARIGEAILLGRETIERRPWPGTQQDAFVLHAEVLEVKNKPSLPIGARGEDAFGGHPAFDDRGTGARALLNVGREDAVVEGLDPLPAGISVIGASSGYLLADVTAASPAIRVGDEVAFSPNYAALLAAMTSEYVHKQVLR